MPVYFNRPVQWLTASAVAVLLSVSIAPLIPATALRVMAAQSDQSRFPPQVIFTGDGDHKNMIEQLGIKTLRPGANPNDQTIYDETTANKYPLPELMTMKNGKKVTKASQWPTRRAEIREDFEREVYGRIPKNVPKVNWEVTNKSTGNIGGIPAITKILVGHVDNSAYPLIKVDIQASVTTPANATGPVPVMVEFDWGFRRGTTPPAWQQQLIAEGWGYASISPTSIQADGPALTSGIIGLTNKGQPRKPDDWGALRAWQWGVSRLLDYFETDKAVDVRQVGIEGLSRYGKAALVTEAFEPRIAIGFIKADMVVEPGEVVFVLTEESLELSGKIMAHLMPKRKLSHEGILVLGGFCVDPLYSGKLLIGLYNFSSSRFTLEPRRKLIAAVFYELQEGERGDFGKPESSVNDFPGELVRLISAYQPIDLRHLRDDISSLENQISGLRNEITTDKEWKKDFQTKLEMQASNIDKLLKGLDDEKENRLATEKSVQEQLSSLKVLHATSDTQSKSSHTLYVTILSIVVTFILTVILTLLTIWLTTRN